MLSAMALFGKACLPARAFLPRPARQAGKYAAVLAGAATIVLASCAGLPDLASAPLPEPIAARNVIATESEWLGQPALRLELTGEEQARQRAGAGGNRPTFIVLGSGFSDGVIEVDIAASINGKGGEGARGFAGIAFHIDEDAEEFEAVYLRFANGTLNEPPPPPPRDIRAVQYIAHPGFHFEESRRVAPGQYEKAAAIGLGRWHRLRIEIDQESLTASVDGAPVLQVDDLRRAGQPGQFGIWVGDGTDAYVANLSVMARGPSQARAGAAEGFRGDP